MKIRNYGLTQRFEVGDAVFHLGWIPRAVNEQIRQRMSALTARATRRALLDLRREHQEDGTPLPTEKEVQQRMLEDPELQNGMQAAHAERVAWAVRGHEGLFDESGGVFPFESVEREFHGQTFKCASDRMVARYAELPAYLDLVIAVLDRNSLDAESKKNSPPPSSSEPSPGGGPAGTA